MDEAEREGGGGCEEGVDDGGWVKRGGGGPGGEVEHCTGRRELGRLSQSLILGHS